MTWIVRKNGQALGSFMESELVTLLRSGQLTWLDLAIRRGDSSWRTLLEVPELYTRVTEQPYRKSEGSTKESTSASGNWIVRCERPGRVVQMFSNLSNEDVRANLATGRMSYSDLIWKKGDSQWSRIGDHGDFREVKGEPTEETISSPLSSASPVSAIEVPKVEFPISRDELLASLYDSAKLKLNADERPDEASGEDLVGRPSWLPFDGCLQATLACIAFGLALGSTALAQGGANTDVPVPTTVEIAGLKLSSSTPTLVVQTNAALDDTIRVDIRGESGEILERMSIVRHLVIHRNPGEVPLINLAEQKLPNGLYHVSAQVQRGAETRPLTPANTIATSLTDVFIGTNDTHFQEALLQHQKKIAFEQQQEKKTLFYSSRALAKTAQKLKSLKENVRLASDESKLRELRERQQKERIHIEELFAGGESNLAYPEQLAALREASHQLEEALREPAGERAIASAEAGVSVQRTSEAMTELDLKFKKLRSIASELSVHAHSAKPTPDAKPDSGQE